MQNLLSKIKVFHKKVEKEQVNNFSFIEEPFYLIEKQKQQCYLILNSITENTLTLTLSRLGIRNEETYNIEEDYDPTKLTEGTILELWKSIPKYTSLTEIDFSYNRLMNVPECLSQLKENLKILNLCGNHLGGSKEQDPLFTTQYLINLEELDISYNYINNLLYLPNSIKILNVKHNRTLEYLPESFYKNHTNLISINFLYCSLKSLETIQNKKSKDNEEQEQQIHDNIGLLIHVEDLLIAGNRNLKELPKEIENLTKLKNLSLHHQPISILPMKFQNYKYLQNIQLNRCLLQVLPDCFKDLCELKYLDISMNHFDSFPIVICSLHSLRVFKACGFNWTTLPDEFCNLNQLKSLILRFNRFENIPNCLYALNQLKKLDLVGNFINEISDEHPIDEWKQLKLLSLSHNPLKTVCIKIINDIKKQNLFIFFLFFFLDSKFFKKITKFK